MSITIGAGNQQIDADNTIHQALNHNIYVRVPTRDPWILPATGNDGRIGKLTVSRYHLEPVTGANQSLAVHVTFTINQIFVPSQTGATRRGNPEAIRVEIANLHFTARPLNVQFAINGDNFVANTPANRNVATHRGAVNNWLHVSSDERCRDIATSIGLTADDAAQLGTARTAINNGLADYTGEALTALRAQITTAVRGEIEDHLMPANLRETVTINVTFS